jgi:FkbM family methyltransferase
MPALVQRLRRAREAADLLSRYAADWRTRRVLLACYRTILRTVVDPREESLRLRIAGRTVAFRMRRSDLFTLSEILHEGQYALRSPLPPEPTIVDAGANVGVAAVWFLAHHPGARLHAFEPEAENFRLLSENLGPFPGAVLNRAAVGARDATVELHLASHGAVHSVRDAEVGARTVEVPCVALGGYLARHSIRRVDLLKLDVEGSEADAVEGLGPRLADVGVIVGEMHERLVDVPALYERLAAAGFRPLFRKHFGDGEAQGVHAFEVARAAGPAGPSH